MAWNYDEDIRYTIFGGIRSNRKLLPSGKCNQIHAWRLALRFLIASFFFVIMMVWYKAYKTRQRNLKLVKIKDFLPVIKDLKADTTIAKYASNLVFINWARKEDEVEDKLIYSILRKQPKRADHYWLIHLDMVDEPQTLEYTVDTLLEDTVFNIRIKIGFRVQPFVSLVPTSDN